MSMKFPIAQKKNKSLKIHNDIRIDPYYWMNDRENPEVIKYLEEENNYLEEQLKGIKPLRKQLFEEMKGRIKEDDTSVPYFYNGYFYITRHEKGREYPIYSRKKGSLEAEEEILLDVNKMAEGHSFYHLGNLEISPNNQILAYAEDTKGRRIYTIKFIDLNTRKSLTDVIPNTTGNFEWANDNHTFFYTIKDEALRPYKILKHQLGKDVTDDKLIYHEKDDTFRTYIYKTKSEQFLVIGSSQTVSSEYRILNANTPDKPFQLFQKRERTHEFEIFHHGEYWYILTNWDAENFRLMKTSIHHTAQDNWTEVIAHNPDVLLEDIEIFENYLVVAERKAGLAQLKVIPNDGQPYYLPFEESAYVVAFSDNFQFDTKLLRIEYQSMTTPPSVYDFNMQQKTFNLLKETPILGGFDKNDYQSERFYVPSRDGVKIPVSFVAKKGFKSNSNRPILLYAYGSYGHSTEPYFSSVRLSLLNRGFGFAIAHIRGGEEMGRSWYEDGKLLNKKNTFNDFIDCAQYLIDKKYSSYPQVYAMGGSAGGLLMGAVINQRPSLWKGVVAAVPFVDVVTTMLDDSIPLTTGEYDEWGNPNEKKYYDYIKSYSPYDNIVKKAYPPILVTSGLHDSQVQYWEPTKWVAKLRDFKTDNNLLLLHTNMEAGHGGASGRFEQLKEIALEYAFFLKLEDIQK